MSKDRMRYDLLVQDALDRAQRSVVKAALQRVAKEGLPGTHHFYITFGTDAEGVEISQMLRAQYPEQMRIVLQNQFWGLTVDDEGFSVGLSFNQVPQSLRIPYSAILSFDDPAVQFTLQFQPRPSADSPTPVVALKSAESSGPRMIADAFAPPPKPKKPAEPGDVVSLDAFRKK